MLSLSEDVTALKLQTLQDKRQIMLFRENKRRLEATIASHEAMLAAADCARVEAETRLLLGTTETIDGNRRCSTSMSADKIESCISPSSEIVRVPKYQALSLSIDTRGSRRRNTTRPSYVTVSRKHVS